METDAAHALLRFGLGGRLSEPPPADPRADLLRQLAASDPLAGAVPGLPTAADGIERLNHLRADRRARRQAATPLPPPDPPAPVAAPRPGEAFRAEARALIDDALATAAPFRERLVWFWFNHFTVSARRPAVGPLVGPFVREAIRPHVTGRFADMLLAVVRHPAMLLFLDNAGSAGPGSTVGRRGRRGLNENLARECLELHTVGTAAGYAQDDVSAFARVLTGWSIERRDPPFGFRFRPALHEPGGKTVLGRAVPEGEEGGVALLRFLADHPATHRHLATKLARHFVSDDPPPAAVGRIEGALRDTRGDLGAAAAAVLDAPEAWQPLAKLRSPQEFVVAALRATGLPAQRRPDPVAAATALGQPLWLAPFPIGWPDRAADWAGPEALLRRIDWAYALAGRAEGLDPEAVAAAALGPLLSDRTALAVRRAGSRRDALTLLLSSPEFQRR